MEISRFDYRRYLPVSDRKKGLFINNPEDLWHFQNCLMRELLWSGEDVRGLMDHMSYVSEMARTGIFDIRALVEYDEEMLERARNWGVGVFHGADTQLSNTKLGVAGTKAARAAASANHKNRYSNKRGGDGGGGGGNRQNHYKKESKVLTGWRKLAGDHGVCFRFCQDFPCESNCNYKHQCLYCDSLIHSMGACPKQGRGDSKA